MRYIYNMMKDDSNNYLDVFWDFICAVQNIAKRYRFYRGHIAVQEHGRITLSFRRHETETNNNVLKFTINKRLIIIDYYKDNCTYSKSLPRNTPHLIRMAIKDLLQCPLNLLTNDCRRTYQRNKKIPYPPPPDEENKRLLRIKEKKERHRDKQFIPVNLEHGKRVKELVSEEKGYCWDCGKAKHVCRCAEHIYKRYFSVAPSNKAVDGDYTDGFSPVGDSC